MGTSERAELPEMPKPTYTNENGWNVGECLDWLELTVMASSDPDSAYRQAIRSLEEGIAPSETIQHIEPARAQFSTKLANEAATRGDKGDIRTWQRRIGLTVRLDRMESFDSIVQTIVGQWKTLPSEVKDEKTAVAELVTAALKSHPSISGLHRASIEDRLNPALTEAGYKGQLFEGLYETRRQITACVVGELITVR